MNSIKINKVSINSFILLIVAMFFSIATSFAQNDLYTTKIKDGSVANSSAAASENTVLELESVSKGFLLPRLTTSQRNAISIADKERGNGLTIYNIDTDCVNYWSKTGNRWLSLCGSLPPAIMDISNCNAIKLSASGSDMLTQGKYLRETDVLYITVKVEEPGSFNISAVSNNGYSFSKSGTFDTTGVYTIALDGLGTPLQANEQSGDLISFSFNGKPAPTNCMFSIKVKSSALSFTLEPQDVQANWDAYIGVPLNANDNRIDLTVNVTALGFWRITSNSENGMSFNGTGEFTSTGSQTISVVGQGIPVKSTPIGNPSIFNFTTNSSANNAPTNVKARVNVKPVSYNYLCDDPNNKIEFRGEYKQDVKLGRNNAILLPVTVLAPGTTTIELIGTMHASSGNTQVKYTAKDVYLSFNKSRNDVQYVTLYPEEVLVPRGVSAITFDSALNSNICTTFPEIKVKEQVVRYSVECSSVVVNGNYLVDTDISKNSISLKISVDYPGDYSIVTNQLNDVSFSASGTFDKPGQYVVELKPSGNYKQSGRLTYMITTDSQSGSTVCSTTVNVIDRDIVILTLGNVNYGASPSANTYAGSAILKSIKNFGPNGIVKVNNIRVLTTGLQGESLRSYIINNKVDIIHNVIGYNANQATLNVFDWFVKTEKGVLIISDENTAHTSSKQFMESLTGQSIGNASGKFTMINPVLDSAQDESIVKGPFGSLKDKYIGNDASNGWYFDGVRSNTELTPLIVRNDGSGDTWGLKHKTLGFAFFGDGGWVVGTMTNTSTNVWPSRYTADGTPIGKPYDKGSTVYNSVLYANLMAWAIEYVKENKSVK
ncbi:hypothetical protein MODO_0963 [Myroides odoratimimus]|uniref:hypothetical protein n=1 Tax=Myroides odoratimimus TaxID=76832 RepID=UPI000354369F|nr:hypothetical protein [Myroides odoratimimus]EPH13023.1 hypothetical protein HMPREF9713_00752 [Myroides odoratimimus CCUG 12700]GAQ13313.1 hypothetical protein MODO_0963 [Myroides odoratimimus]STZ48858.1 Uncharacterised protein [Myroides odoratimimus]